MTKYYIHTREADGGGIVKLDDGRDDIDFRLDSTSYPYALYDSHLAARHIADAFNDKHPLLDLVVLEQNHHHYDLW